MTDETGGQYGSQPHPEFAAPQDPRAGSRLGAGPYFGPPTGSTPSQGYPAPAPQGGPRPVGAQQPGIQQPGMQQQPRQQPQRPGVAGFPYRVAEPIRQVDQRPAMITLSLVMIITGSLLWMAALGFTWIFAYVARGSFAYGGAEGAIYHMLESFHLRMINGLAAVLFGAPAVAVVMSFFLLKRAPWPRIVISAVGVVSIVLAGALLSNELIWILPGAAYIAFACLILWTPAVSQWCTSTRPADVPG
ncbi:hypothetical protein FOE78_23340 [Microlunatus elymi]|uniref:Uncharacterized protein n=1 Tax=Microlunatus elymi TaxID=2596828 RepID=A0A516Q4Z5_9ACTN|nr:hypothetical protein [Microlunatus elymi]QDP98445.1 hypothetical protein FOE78_23340 [Microlunatus elymi]